MAILSDTHGQVAPTLLQTIERCDMVVHAGDICGAGVLAALRPRGGQIFAVRGNNDREALWLEHEHAVLEKIPETLHLKLPGGTLVVEHGHRHGAHQPSHDSLRRTHPDARVIVYGHTHKLLIDNEQQPWIVNPGAAGYTRNHGGSSCLLLHATTMDWRFEIVKCTQSAKVVA